MQDTFSKYFHQSTCAKVVSADKMMVHARGPVWHGKYQTQGIIPKGRHGVDTDGTWSYSKSDGWVYGHGTFCLVACKQRMLGAFKWMRNSGHEAKRMWLETSLIADRPKWFQNRVGLHWGQNKTVSRFNAAGM